MASDLKKNSVTVFVLIKYKWLNGVQKPFIKYWKTGKSYQVSFTKSSS